MSGPCVHPGRAFSVLAMPSKIEKLKATLARSRKKARESAERTTNIALTVGSGYGAGYVTGRYKDTVTVGEDETTKKGGVNTLMIGGGLIAAGAAVDMVPEWLGAMGVGTLTGTLFGEGLKKGQEDAAKP